MLSRDHFDFFLGDLSFLFLVDFLLELGEGPLGGLADSDPALVEGMARDELAPWAGVAAFLGVARGGEARVT